VFLAKQGQALATKKLLNFYPLAQPTCLAMSLKDTFGLNLGTLSATGKGA